MKIIGTQISLLDHAIAGFNKQMITPKCPKNDSDCGITLGCESQSNFIRYISASGAKPRRKVFSVMQQVSTN